MVISGVFNLKTEWKIASLPVSKKIVIGKVNIEKNLWDLKSQIDITNDAIIAVSDYLLSTNQAMGVKGVDGCYYKISLTKLGDADHE